MHIVEAADTALDDMMSVERAAFGQDEEAELVRALLQDPSARPWLSLLAWADGRPVGHVLFTAARLQGASYPVTAAILAPLAVVPAAQGRGIGAALIEAGMSRLARAGVGLVFLAGHPGYYPRFDFMPASRHRLLPPFPVEPDEGWMVRALAPGLIGVVHGQVACADILNDPSYWRE